MIKRVVGNSRIASVIILILMATGEKKWYDLLRIHTLAMDNWIIQDF